MPFDVLTVSQAGVADCIKMKTPEDALVTPGNSNQ